MKFKVIRNLASVLVLSTVSTALYAQGNCELLPGQTDRNNDGYADQYVSPNATIVNSEIDCTAHNIAAGAVVRSSNISGRVSIARDARVLRSFVKFTVIEASARVIDSAVEDGTRITRSTIGARTIVRNGSSMFGVTIGRDSFINNASIVESQVGSDSNIANSTVDSFNIGDDVRIINNSELFGNSSSNSVLGDGSLVKDGAAIIGPIEIGPNARFNADVVTEGFKFIGGGANFGAGTVLGTDGDILGNFRTGKNVTVANLADIGANNAFWTNVQVGFSILTLSDVVIRRDAVVGDDVILNNKVVIGKAARIGNGAEIKAQVRVGDRATVGSNVFIGFAAFVRNGADVPDGFRIRANSIFPDDYR